MSYPILSLSIRYEQDTVAARQRARQIARLLGFDGQDQTRIATAVSEIARNAFNYGRGGKVEYLLEGVTAPQLFIIKISDNGPGIADVQAVLDGRYRSETGMGIGISGSRRLLDQFDIESSPGKGTTVWLKKLLPVRSGLIKQDDFTRIAEVLVRERTQDSMQELRYQNQELLNALEEIRSRQTELVRLNRELEDTNRGVVALYAELDEKADHLRRADELKSKFLSNMSHEFRSPLNSILALSGLLLDRADGDLNSEQDQQVGYIRRAAQDLLELVNDLLDLAKVEAGKVELRPAEFEAANLFAALRGMLRPLLVTKSVDLVFEDASPIGILYSDEGKIAQILRNYISNALKFTERGEVRVKVAAVENDEILFSVSDTGIGIAREHLDLIFQDFVQLDNPIQKRVKGTGLGLPLSKKLAELLKGSVSVESQVGVGSTFCLRIPRRFQEAGEVETTAPAEILVDPSSSPVLFVEDSAEMVLTYKHHLRDSGFQVLHAATTREAEDILERVHPRAVVLDIILRAEYAWDFLAKLKSKPATEDIPVLVISTVDDKAKAYHLGAAGYLIKPVDRTDLINELRTVTGAPPLRQVLIIDDNEMDRYVLKQQLRKLSVSISEASTGKEGLRKAREQKPAMIFLDLVMPDRTGFQVLESLKMESALREIPVVIATSCVLEAAERSRLLQKAVAVIRKDSLSQFDMAGLVADALKTATLTRSAN
ncbi:MAG TPA: ATP-binding protein [Bryobacteraceae bacterium]|jgi:signal transduction histidine kinase/CheY-like chemotaxis protein